MKKTLLMAAAVLGARRGGPAAAQYYRHCRHRLRSASLSGTYGVDTAYDARIGQLQARLDAGVRAGTIDQREAYRLAARSIRSRGSRPARAMTARARTSVPTFSGGSARSARTCAYADSGNWDRYERYGYDDRAYGNGYGYGYGPSAGAGYYGQGGPYEEAVVCEQRSGIGSADRQRVRPELLPRRRSRPVEPLRRAEPVPQTRIATIRASITARTAAPSTASTRGPTPSSASTRCASREAARA
jgi:hypothetical protein